MPKEDDEASSVVRGIRLDLAIAVCALLISSMAAGASWWQARVMQAQTQVLQEQLGAQVWPYLSVTEGISNDTVSIAVANDGLGPAILGSFTALADGVPKSSFIDIAHALLGPHLAARKPRGERMGFTIDSGARGSVIRPGDRSLGFSLTSKSFARPFLERYPRLSFKICYCAIVEGKCWLSDSTSGRPPKPLQACPEIPSDLLHASGIDDLVNQNI